MRIFVTGAKGRIGRELVRLGASPLDGDILDYELMKQQVKELNPNVVIHCAGISGVDECEQDWKETYAVNVRGTSNVLSACNRTQTGFILLSSDHVYDENWRGKHAEGDGIFKLQGKSYYAQSKIGAEVVLKNFGGGKSIRLSTVFSPEMSLDTNPPVFITRNYGYVRHIAQGIMYCAEHYGTMPPVLNLGGTDLLSMYEFMLMYADVMGQDKMKINPRKEKIKTFVPRPFKGGLNLHLARHFKVPLYSALEGLEQMKKDLVV